MKQKRNANIIILIVIALLFMLLICVTLLITEISKVDDNSVNISVSTGDEKDTELKTVKEIIEESGSKYITESGKSILNIDVIFKYDLYDENGKSKKSYFYDIIEQIQEIEIKDKRSFSINDAEKNIEILSKYDDRKNKYIVTINKLEDFFDQVDGDTYLEVTNFKELEYSDLQINNSLIYSITNNSAYYADTILADKSRVQLENGYFSYRDGQILARLQHGKALNVIFTKDYKDEPIAIGNIYADAKLSDIIKQYGQNSFGSVRDGYLGYITQNAYVFFYEDEVSVYQHEYKENSYFDDYLTEYFETNNLERLVSNFTTNWTSYFEKEYDAELGNFKISFPLRGILIDIKNNNPEGVTLYNNYYLSDKAKALIKSKKVTFEKDKNLVDIVEKNRRESMK